MPQPAIDHLLAAYRKQAAITATTAPADKSSVRRYNAAADELRRLATEIGSLGSDAIEQFAALVTTPDTRLWAAFHLLDVIPSPSHLVDAAFAILEEDARGNDLTALGIRMRLKELRRDFNRAH